MKYSFANPTIVTITAPTCSGKSFLIERLCDTMNFKRVVSCTSRAQRHNEVNGVDYHFIDRGKFDDKSKFVETNEFLGNMYGVSVASLFDAASEDNTAVVIVDPNGLQAFEKVSHSLGVNLFKVFVHTPEQVKLQRLYARSRDEIKTANLAEIEQIMERGRIREHNMVTAERLWKTQRVWDAIVPGDNIEEALDLIARGIVYRNSRSAAPKPYIHEGA